MRKENEGPGSSNEGFHILQPLRDLEANWGVDLAKNLEDYLLKICSGEIGDDHCLSVNFAEAALLLQGSVQVYSRKVEYLYSLVLHALEFINEKRNREQDHPEGASTEAEENTVNDEDNDPFWVSDEIPVDAKNMLDNTTHRDSSSAQFVKAPANLVVLEGDCLDSTGESGELDSYLLATCDLYRDFILLDSCDAVAVDSFLENDDIVGKGLNNSCRGNSLTSKRQKSFLSPTRRSGGTGIKFSSRKNEDANLYMSPRVDLVFGPPENCNDDEEMPDNYEAGHGGGDGYSEPGDSVDSDDDDEEKEEDPWKPLNPHETGTLKVKPFRKVNFNRRQGANTRKRMSLATDFPVARLPDIISSDLNDIWEKKCRVMKNQGNSQSPAPFEKLRESLIKGENKDYDGPKEDDEENQYDSGDHDFGPPDFDLPEAADEDVTPLGEKHENFSPHFGDSVHEDPIAHANLEDLCRHHLDFLVDELTETENELAARVSSWKQRIEQNMEEQESHPAFDIAEYGARILNKLSLEGNSRNLMSFSSVVSGQQKHDVARTFSALLQLVNNGDVDLERGGTNELTCYTGVNPFYVRFLKHGNRCSKETANSPISNGHVRKRKKNGKENVGSSACGFSVKVGKVSWTPQGKKRRKSIIKEAVELDSS